MVSETLQDRLGILEREVNAVRSRRPLRDFAADSDIIEGANAAEDFLQTL